MRSFFFFFPSLLQETKLSVHLSPFLSIYISQFEICNLSGGLLIRTGKIVVKVVILAGYRLQSQS